MTAALDWAARAAQAIAAVAAAREDEIAIGTTPKRAVAARDDATLHRYARAAPPADLPPILLVHGLVGRPTIADLDADRSLVGDLLGRGLDVWAVDWGRPARADRHKSLDDFVCDYLQWFSYRTTCGAGRRPVLLGVCEGGLFTLALAALAPRAVAGVVPVVTPVSTHADPAALLTLWTRAFSSDELTRLVDAVGYLPGGMMGSIFQALTPARTAA